MLFNSGIFLFIFLPLTLIVFYTLGRIGQLRLALVALLLASWIYYAWWNPVYLPLILGTILFNYLVGMAIQRQQDEAAPAKPLLIAGIVLNLALLGYYKYANFFVDNLNAVTGTGIELAPIVLPLAISFHTFQQIAYLVDVYQRKVTEPDLIRYFLFVSFFPQLLAGPIVHHKEMMPQFANKSIGRFRLDDLLIGGMIFFIGLFKKVMLADNVAPYANQVFDASLAGEPISFIAAWTGALAYTCQIYFDFSGYSDMAIGLGRMFGIGLPLNFNSPYQATGIIDFWRRWHMTLSRFLRDYLYIPLGGNRLGPARRYTNMMLVMLIGGFWHGAGWNFVIWGGLHGTYLGVNHAWRAWRGASASSGWVAVGSSRVITFLAVVVAWVFFRAVNLDSALTVIGAMVGLDGENPESIVDLLRQIERPAAILIAALLLVAWFAPNTQQIMRDFMDRDGAPKYERQETMSLSRLLTWHPTPAYAITLAFITAITIMSLWQPSEFIYYQF